MSGLSSKRGIDRGGRNVERRIGSVRPEEISRQTKKPKSEKTK